MITSEKAIEKLKDEMINRVSHVGLGFRVYKDSAGEGSSRLALKLDNKCPDDETIESHGIRLFIDPFNAAQLKDLELDFIDGPTGGFILKNTKKTM
jgi:Fe-S cluster assembly iron-binding protein IscA